MTARFFSLTTNYRCAKCGEVHLNFAGRRRIQLGKYLRWVCPSCFNEHQNQKEKKC